MKKGSVFALIAVTLAVGFVGGMCTQRWVLDPDINKILMHVFQERGKPDELVMAIDVLTEDMAQLYHGTFTLNRGERPFTIAGVKKGLLFDPFLVEKEGQESYARPHIYISWW